MRCDTMRAKRGSQYARRTTLVGSCGTIVSTKKETTGIAARARPYCAGELLKEFG